MSMTSEGETSISDHLAGDNSWLSSLLNDGEVKRALRSACRDAGLPPPGDLILSFWLDKALRGAAV